MSLFCTTNDSDKEIVIEKNHKANKILTRDNFKNLMEFEYSCSESDDDCLSEDDEKLESKKKVKLEKSDIRSNIESNFFEFEEYQDENFFQKLGQYTFGLDKVIPWEDSNFIFSGGLLYDILRNKFSNDLMDIDLFFFGSADSKLKTINKLLDRLDMEQYYYLVGINQSVIYIFVQGIPRIIQLIMTDKTNPETIVSSFDLTHVMSWTNGTKVFVSNVTIPQIKNNTSNLNIIKNKQRIIKYVERGVDLEHVLLSDFNFIMSKYISEKIIMTDKQKELYRLSGNLTKYPNSYDPIDFKAFQKNLIDFNCFGCKVNYDKLDNHDFKEDVNMFGAFTNYFGMDGQEVSDILNPECITDWNYCVSVDFTENNQIQRCGNYVRGEICAIANKESLYVSCKFICIDDVISSQIDNLVAYAYFEIENKDIIKYLSTIIDINRIINQFIEKQKKSKKYEDLNREKIPIVYTYLLDSTQLDNFNNLPYKPNSSNLLIKSSIFEYLKNDNQSNLDILEKIKDLNHCDNVNCLFDLNINVKYNNNLKDLIKYIDVNLSPRHIYKK
jgi:hypothetical protein